MTGEKAWQKLHKYTARNIEQVLKAAPQEAEVVRSPTTHHENYPN